MTTDAKEHQEAQETCGATYQREHDLTARCTLDRGHEGAHHDGAQLYSWLRGATRAEYLDESHGAPQSGGFSGVAATPDEGAGKPRSYGDGYERFGEAWIGKGEVVVSGTPGEDDESHDCDAMGCGQWHVLYRAPLAAPAPPSPRAEAVTLWECPDCGFAFDARHEDEPNGGHSCPVCELNALRSPPRAEAPANLLTRVLLHEAETEDAAAALAAARDRLSVTRLRLPERDYRELCQFVEAAFAALRRAAPGAAPEREELPDAVMLAQAMREIERKADDTILSGDVREFRRFPAEIGTIARRALAAATPAPTGERAGGEAEAEALRRAASIVRRSAARFPRSGHEQSENALADHLDALASQRAPVAAPRGTEGRDDA